MTMSFYQALSKHYDVLFPSNPKQIEFLLGRIKPGGSVLDVAAGTGETATALCKQGLNVSAMDLDAGMVEGIQAKIGSPGLTGRLSAQVLDMRKLSALAPMQFDSVICIGNSIVHLDRLEEVRQVLQLMKERIRQGGTLILQTVNYDRILSEGIRELPLLEKPITDGWIRFSRLYEPLGDKIRFIGILEKEAGGRIERWENAVELLPIRAAEMSAALYEAGFDPSALKLYGSFSGEPYRQDSPAVVIEAAH
jgi:glycine/sarcosine N-methyltransferase